MIAAGAGRRNEADVVDEHLAGFEADVIGPFFEGTRCPQADDKGIRFAKLPIGIAICAAAAGDPK